MKTAFLDFATLRPEDLETEAASEKLGTVPEDASVNAHVGIGPRSDGGFGLKVKLEVSLPGLERDVAEKIAERGHFICPYSNATKGNIEVEIVVL